MFGLLVCWFAGLLFCWWFVGLLVFAGLLVCWLAGLLVCWLTKAKDIKRKGGKVERSKGLMPKCTNKAYILAPELEDSR